MDFLYLNFSETGGDFVVETETYSTLVGEVLCLSFDYLGFQTAEDGLGRVDVVDWNESNFIIETFRLYCHLGVEDDLVRVGVKEDGVVNWNVQI